MELDIIVGRWAEQKLPSEDDDFLRAFSEVLDEENPELFKWLTCQEQPPPRVARNASFLSLRAHVVRCLTEKSDRATRAARGREWIRGWGDGSSGGQQ